MRMAATKTPPNRVGRLVYPIEKSLRYSTKIKFTAIQITPPKVSGLGVANAFKNVADAAVNAVTGEQGGPPGLGGNQTKKTNKEPVSNLKFRNIPGEVANLYVPLGGFQVNDGFDYAQSTLGLFGAGVVGALNQGGTLVGSAMKGLSEAGQTISDVASAFFESGELGRAATARAAQAVGPAGGIAVRTTMNPNIRTNFNGVSVREFTFNFKFIPCSPQESLAVKSIIQFFRFHAYPEEIGSGGSFSVALEYPNMFKIQLLSESGDNRFKNIGTPIKMSYLKGISTTYNPTSPVLHDDGSPTEVDMNLTFVEYKAQTRKDIINENSDTFYHFENGQDISERGPANQSGSNNNIGSVSQGEAGR